MSSDEVGVVDDDFVPEAFNRKADVSYAAYVDLPAGRFTHRHADIVVVDDDRFDLRVRPEHTADGGPCPVEWWK